MKCDQCQLRFWGFEFPLWSFFAPGHYCSWACKQRAELNLLSAEDKRRAAVELWG